MFGRQSWFTSKIILLGTLDVSCLKRASFYDLSLFFRWYCNWSLLDLKLLVTRVDLESVCDSFTGLRTGILLIAFNRFDWVIAMRSCWLKLLSRAIVVHKLQSHFGLRGSLAWDTGSTGVWPVCDPHCKTEHRLERAVSDLLQGTAHWVLLWVPYLKVCSFGYIRFNAQQVVYNFQILSLDLSFGLAPELLIQWGVSLTRCWCASTVTS